MNWRESDPVEILDRIEAAEIIGMGGAGFPTHAKIRTASRNESPLVIGNGIECDPGVSADETLMSHYPKDVLEGLMIVAHCLRTNQIFLATKSRACFSVLKDVGCDNVSIKLLQSNASQGEERVLVKRVTRTEIALHEYPASLGIIVLNVATLFTICEAVRDGFRPRDRIMSILEEDVWVDFGTPLRELAHVTNGIRCGGPVTGLAASPETVTDATHNAIVIDSSNPSTSCIRCGWCNDVCPRHLPVMDLYLNVLHSEANSMYVDDFSLCHECGACAVACPSDIQLVDYLRHGKKASNAAVQSEANTAAALARYQSRLERTRKWEKQTKTERITRLQKSRTW